MPETENQTPPTKARQTGRAFPIPKTEPRQFPVVELAVAPGRSTQTCKRALRELEDAGADHLADTPEALGDYILA